MQTFLTTHSGANNTEANSIEYLNSCIESNAKYIEVDIRITKDNILILHHDNKIGPKYINQSLFNELIKIKPNLLKIEDIFDFAKKNYFYINFDLKSVKASTILATEIEKNHFIDRCVISGCKTNETKLLLRCNPRLKIIYNVESNDLIQINSIIKKIIKLNIFGINLDYKILTENLYKKLITTNLPIFIWTIDKEEEFEYCKKFNLFSITTNNPNLFKKYYKIN